MKYITPDRIVKAINKERERQQDKYGTVVESPRSIIEYIVIMEKELQEAKEAFFEPESDKNMLIEILHTIAVGVACLEEWTLE